MSDAPKLYTNKPKKAQLKQFQEQVKGKDFSSPAAAAAASYTMGSQPTPPPPPPPPKQSFAKRYKFLWPLLLAVNFSVGAYLFMRTRKKDSDITEDTTKYAPSMPVSTTVVSASPVAEKPLPMAPIAAPVKLPEPIPESQQRELFKWILEEKRKVKPADSEAKKHLDEEKALLKQLIRAKSIPGI